MSEAHIIAGPAIRAMSRTVSTQLVLLHAPPRRICKVELCAFHADILVRPVLNSPFVFRVSMGFSSMAPVTLAAKVHSMPQPKWPVCLARRPAANALLLLKAAPSA